MVVNLVRGFVCFNIISVQTINGRKSVKPSTGILILSECFVPGKSTWLVVFGAPFYMCVRVVGDVISLVE